MNQQTTAHQQYEMTHKPLSYCLLAGAFAGLAGGILSATVVSFPTGLWMHLALSLLLGIVFGFCFRNRFTTSGESVLWGQSFGLLWWLLGGTTLLPLLTGGTLLWTLDMLPPIGTSTAWLGLWLWRGNRTNLPLAVAQWL